MSILTTITGVFVRNTDTQQTTTTKVTNEQTIYISQLPKNWTLAFSFSTTFKQVSFEIDGNLIHIEQGAPFCVNGDNSPINLPVGSHTITIAVDQQLPLFFTVHVAQQPVVIPPVVPSVIPAGLPVYYVDGVTGNDTNLGTLAKPFKTARAINKAAVVLAAGQTFGAISFANLTGAWVGSTDAAKPATLSAEYVVQYSDTSTGCILQNVVLTSADGKGLGSNHHGTNNQFINVSFGNLSEGIDHSKATNVTIIGGKQVGKVAGRCHFFIDVAGLTWKDSGPFGPASSQSPVRFSYPGVRGGTISNVAVTQVGSSFPIACWAIHAASNVTFNSCSANGGEFSFNSAGAGEGTDKVSGCVINDLVVTNAKLTLVANVSFNNVFNRPVVTNAGGECISLGDTTSNGGNKIVGGKLTSTKHGVHFYGANDTVISNTTLYAPALTVPVIDGVNTKANDGGGNKTVAA